MYYYLKKDSYYQIIVSLALTCGLRVGKIMGLTWNDIDFKNNSIPITKQWKKRKDDCFWIH
ncbi:tyrosine-type recombinase/integrase [Clostridium sardiniense]|uniref:Tyrosine-type recombinase/integrase n=1 Tax=Clostridium sardiniense TaxID=29369 RepID=A0ABS7L0A7_CLOSR|nr:tyrosine-type recombinase/integrase [Clostridium sardiniense]MBY0756496.1 tyrosine-type recombinase/integrase [Clostridium sardiniense]MDQ0460241.1 integrase [Clostridium sardiniense]